MTFTRHHNGNVRRLGEETSNTDSTWLYLVISNNAIIYLFLEPVVITHHKIHRMTKTLKISKSPRHAANSPKTWSPSFLFAIILALSAGFSIRNMKEYTSNYLAHLMKSDDERPSFRIDGQNVLRDRKPNITSINQEIPGKQTIYVLRTSGLGSQLMHMLSHKLYYNAQGRNFMADTSTYGYRWSDSIGLLTGYFLPTFPVIDDISQYRGIADRYNMSNYGHIRNIGLKYSYDLTDLEPVIVVPGAQRLIRKKIFSNYKVESVGYYNSMAWEACAELQFNDRAISEIEKVKNDHDIPNFRRGRTAAFHVRRGDKLRRESKLYKGSLYVDKLLTIASGPIDRCFVASDDYRAFEEVKRDILKRNINCTIHTITSKSKRGSEQGKSTQSDHEETVRFLAELSILIDATYFIGTFNSNVASLVALKRKCIHNEAPNYAHSYGVDRDTWYLR